MLTKQPHRPFCINCKVNLAKSNGISTHGFKKWHKYCVQCSKAMYNKKYGYLLDKQNKCENCDFIPEDSCQLDLVYLDDNKKNKNSNNLKTLCANCSRLHAKNMRKKRKSVLDVTVDSDVRI